MNSAGMSEEDIDPIGSRNGKNPRSYTGIFIGL
jgi:hypothetical protein